MGVDESNAKLAHDANQMQASALLRQPVALPKLLIERERSQRRSSLAYILILQNALNSTARVDTQIASFGCFPACVRKVA
jgi:hypothetical protein